MFIQRLLRRLFNLHVILSIVTVVMLPEHDHVLDGMTLLTLQAGQAVRSSQWPLEDMIAGSMIGLAGLILIQHLVGQLRAWLKCGKTG